MSYTTKILLACALFFPGAVYGQQVVATDANSVAAFFRAEGVEPEIETDGAGDPLITVDYYGSNFSIFYYGCEDGATCDAIQFFSGYNTDGGVRLATINTWNTENRYAIAYVSDNGAARIEYDVYLGETGMNPDDFAKLIGIWVRSMRDFEDFIDW